MSPHFSGNTVGICDLGPGASRDSGENMENQGLFGPAFKLQSIAVT